MLQITADVFSGRPNPAWIITDEREARTTLKELAKEQSLLIQEGTGGEPGLGLRGFEIDILDDELALDLNLSPRLYLAAGAQARSTRANEIAERLIGLMDRAIPAPTIAAEETLALDETLRGFLAQQLERIGRISMPDAREEPAAVEKARKIEAAAVCYIEFAAYNPGFWNNDPVVRQRNNCYNYASNWRTNTFAQPGRGCGQMYTAITCPEVARAALCDGMHRRYNCFPDSERPRYLVALVVAPGPGFVDYHWYRKMKEGFWGHKPGGTAVRNLDNSGNIISDPASCDRGPYTHFCGYFYGCNSQRQRIR
jgi:hypothetical protein